MISECGGKDRGQRAGGEEKTKSQKQGVPSLQTPISSSLPLSRPFMSAPILLTHETLDPEKLLKELTLDEKITLTSGIDMHVVSFSSPAQAKSLTSPPSNFFMDGLLF